MTADTEQRIWTAFCYEEDATRDDPHVLARRILDRLIVAAQPVFESHAGDLVFDYEWLKKYAKPATGPEVEPFYWSWDETGTLIGYDHGYVANRPNLYKISIPKPIRSRIDIIISREES